MNNSTLKEKIKPVYIIKGSQTLLIERTLAEIKKKIVKDTSDLDYYEFDCESDSIIEILDNANTYSIFDSKKLIVVKSSEKLDSKDLKLLESYVESPSQNTCLVFISKDPKKPNLKKRENISILIFDNIDEITKKIVEEGKKLGINLTNKAANDIHNLLGEDLKTISYELLKLSQYFNSKDSINEDDINTFITRRNFQDNFQLINAISNKDKKTSLKVLSDLERQNQDPISIFTTISWRFRQIWHVKELVNKNKPREEIAKELKISPGATYYLVKNSENFALGEITRIINLLGNLDSSLKTSYQDKFNLLTNFVMEVCR